MMKPLKFGYESNILTKVKAFGAGVLFTLVILGAIWMKSHYKAVIFAVTNPELVESLQVAKSTQLKK